MKVALLIAISLCVLGLSLSERYLYEDFEVSSLGDSKWIPSGAVKVESDVEVLKYDGEWKIADTVSLPGKKVDHGLVVNVASKLYAISKILDKPLDFQSEKKDFVIQYEVKLNNSLQCGGAYMKLLSYEESFSSEKFDDKTPYTIMFGPDRCGSSQKVHFIFRHKNPLTGKYEEKHLKNPPNPILNQLTNLYTLIVKPDNSFKILVNNKEVRSGSLLVDFNPPVNPPREIDDPNDFKPSNWVDEKMIPDPDAKKPEDWDENEPFEIIDEDAVKPNDWLDNESPVIPDPEAKIPEEWNEEDDGDWEPPTIPNPKCEKVSGCGEWKKPTKANPKYKGKWSPPMISNPLYMGEWKPRLIPNPNFFEDLYPARFTTIGAIGFEIWTLNEGIIFDNILITQSIEEASKMAIELWKPKNEYEESVLPKKKKVSNSFFAVFEEAWDEVLRVSGEFMIDPIQTFRKSPLQLSVIFLTPILILAIIGIALQPGQPQRQQQQKQASESEKKVKEEERLERERKGKDKANE